MLGNAADWWGGLGSDDQQSRPTVKEGNDPRQIFPVHWVRQDHLKAAEAAKDP